MQNLQRLPNVVWKPIPKSSQALALDSRAHQTLYCGSRGPGKTDTQLMKFKRYVGKGYGSFWRGVIFDREYKNLDDIVAKSKRWFHRFDDGAKFNASKSEYKWTWPGGEELLFRVAKNPDDYYNYHGQEFPFQGWNELTKYPTSELYDLMLSTNRSSFTPEKDSPRDRNGNIIKLLPPIPLIVFSTTNSHGAGHIWVKKRFIDPAPYGVIIPRTNKIFNPRSQKFEEITITQVSIFGAFHENPYLDPVYVANLYNIKDPNLRKAWLKGDWNVVGGGVFDDLWDNNIHASLPRFKIPNSWNLNRSFDWGSSHPYSVGFWAEANGEEAILPDGTSFCPPPGTLIQVAEIYGTDEIGTNRGLRHSAARIAKDIRDYENEMINAGWFPSLPEAGPADNQIRDVREEDVDTIESKMADCGVSWTRSDKSAGSRINGLQLFRDRLEASVNWVKASSNDPGVYFTKNCRASISTIPILPRDDKIIDDVDTTAEDHPWDMTRYRVLASDNRIAKKIKIGMPR